MGGGNTQSTGENAGCCGFCLNLKSKTSIVPMTSEVQGIMKPEDVN